MGKALGAIGLQTKQVAEAVANALTLDITMKINAWVVVRSPLKDGETNFIYLIGFIHIYIIIHQRTETDF
jgi:hypothetical protein